MQNVARAARILTIKWNVLAVPEDDRIVGVERDQFVLEAMILHIPDCFLLLLGIRPDCNTEILAILSVAVLLHI